jgi:hypothetical protein
MQMLGVMQMISDDEEWKRMFQQQAWLFGAGVFPPHVIIIYRILILVLIALVIFLWHVFLW